MSIIRSISEWTLVALPMIVPTLTSLILGLPVADALSLGWLAGFAFYSAAFIISVLMWAYRVRRRRPPDV